MNVKHTIVLLALAALLAVALARWTPAEEPVVVAVTPSTASELDALRLQLSRLERDHVATVGRLSELEQFFAVSKLGLVQPLAEASEELEDLDLSEEEVIEPIPQYSAGSGSLARIEQAGLSVEEFEAIEQRVDATNFARFEDRWLRSRQRYLDSEQTPGLADGLRNELGDDTYDRYLFASGRPNRVRVRGVMEGSAAEMAGLSGGDIVISYGSKRVFNFDDLRRLSYQGQPGESVVMEVRGADGSISQLVMPRGPLGLYSDSGWSEAP
jgi:membrane-associated protease RseP (regulator of RpoE activity)